MHGFPLCELHFNDVNLAHKMIFVAVKTGLKWSPHLFDPSYPLFKSLTGYC